MKNNICCLKCFYTLKKWYDYTWIHGLITTDEYFCIIKLRKTKDSLWYIYCKLTSFLNTEYNCFDKAKLSWFLDHPKKVYMTFKTTNIERIYIYICILLYYVRMNFFGNKYKNSLKVLNEYMTCI